MVKYLKTLSFCWEYKDGYDLEIPSNGNGNIWTVRLCQGEGREVEMETKEIRAADGTTR